MTALPDPADLAPTRDPTAYGRRRLFTVTFWAWISLVVLALLAGAAIVIILAPRLIGIQHAPLERAAPAPAVHAADDATTRPPAMTASPAPTGPSEASALSERVGRLESGEGRMLDAAAEALAASALSEAAAQPGPFAQDLAAYERVLPLSPDALALRALAAQGAPTRAALAQELAQAAPEAAVAARRPGRDAGVMEQLSYLFSRVISVRRIDAGARGADAALAQAQSRAAGGDLEGAVSALDALPPAAGDRLADWRARAQRRIEIDRRVANLRTQALLDLSALQRGRP